MGEVKQLIKSYLIHFLTDVWLIPTQESPVDHKVSRSGPENTNSKHTPYELKPSYDWSWA